MAVYAQVAHLDQLLYKLRLPVRIGAGDRRHIVPLGQLGWQRRGQGGPVAVALDQLPLVGRDLLQAARLHPVARPAPVPGLVVDVVPLHLVDIGADVREPVEREPEHLPGQVLAAGHHDPHRVAGQEGFREFPVQPQLAVVLFIRVGVGRLEREAVVLGKRGPVRRGQPRLDRHPVDVVPLERRVRLEDRRIIPGFKRPAHRRQDLEMPGHIHARHAEPDFDPRIHRHIACAIRRVDAPHRKVAAGLERERLHHRAPQRVLHPDGIDRIVRQRPARGDLPGGRPASAAAHQLQFPHVRLDLQHLPDLFLRDPVFAPEGEGGVRCRHPLFGQ